MREKRSRTALKIVRFKNQPKTGEPDRNADKDNRLISAITAHIASTLVADKPPRGPGSPSNGTMISTSVQAIVDPIGSGSGSELGGDFGAGVSVKVRSSAC
jgi:hypothetical protein